MSNLDDPAKPTGWCVIFENEYYHPDSFPPRYGVKNPIVVHGRTIIIEGGCQEPIIEPDAGWIERERV